MQPKLYNTLLDIVSTWASECEGAYLAKENKVVYFDSVTGRKQDAQWISLTLSEVVRVIRATRMGAEGRSLNPDIVISAFQELGRVYEFGVKSRAATKPGIFNYFAEAGYDMAEAIAEAIAREVYSDGFTAVYASCVNDLYDGIVDRLKEDSVSPKDRNELFLKHFSIMGYSVRLGPNRVSINNVKFGAYILPGGKPSDMCRMSMQVARNMSIKIAGQLK